MNHNKTVISDYSATSLKLAVFPSLFSTFEFREVLLVVAMLMLDHSLSVVNDKVAVANVRGDGVVASRGRHLLVLSGDNLLSGEAGTAIRGHGGRPPCRRGRGMHDAVAHCTSLSHYTMVVGQPLLLNQKRSRLWRLLLLFCNS